MPWSGGTFTRSNGVFTGSLVWTDDKNAGTKITSAHHDTHDQDLAQGINACLNKNGQNSPTANISWGGYKITSLAYGSADKESATYGQTITAASINPATKVLTLTRTQGDVTVDLTPIVVAGDTSDFARLSLTNTFTDVCQFTADGLAFPSVTTYTATSGDTSVLWTETFGLGNFSILRAGGQGIEFAIDGVDPAGAVLTVNGYKVWNEANLDVSGYLTASENATITGNWTVSGAWAFSSALQVPSLVLAQSGYSWTASIPSANTLQIAGSGGNYLKVSADVTHTSKLETQGRVYWNDGNMQLLIGVAPTGGTNGDIAFVVTSADQGIWVKNAGSWVKIAS